MERGLRLHVLRGAIFQSTVIAGSLKVTPKIRGRHARTVNTSAWKCQMGLSQKACKNKPKQQQKKTHKSVPLPRRPDETPLYCCVAGQALTDRHIGGKLGGGWLMAPAVPEEQNTGRQLATCSPRRHRDGGAWHCVSPRRAECSAGFRTLFITARKTSTRLPSVLQERLLE